MVHCSLLGKKSLKIKKHKHKFYEGELKLICNDFLFEITLDSIQAKPLAI